MKRQCAWMCAAVLAVGCKVENVPSRAAQTEAKAEKRRDTLTTPHEAPATRVDEAGLVVGACGAALRDEVLPIYDKMDNGPVRRMSYSGLKPVVLDFVPTISESERRERTARFAHGRPVLKPELPANAVWEFSEARMEEEELMSSARLGVYLPCAGGL